MKIALSFSTSLRALGNAYAEPLAAATLQLLHAETGANAAYVSMGLEGFWGRSLGGDLWLVFGEHGGERVVCFAGDHAAATRFASTHRLKAHPETGHAQLVELPGASATSAQPNRLAARSIESLLGAGVPAEWIDTLQTLPDFALGGALAQLPEEARLAVLSWVSPEASPAEEIDVRPRAFAEATDATLGHLLRAPWAEWLVFLHPSQRSIVESEYPRPVLVHGSAGTGKTVVALHRAAHLAKRSGGARVLLTTFTRTLVSSLAARLDQLMHDAPEARTRVVVAGVHQLAWRHAATRASLARREHVVQELERAMKEVLPPEEIDLGYVLAEWDEVVAPQDIRTEKAYLRAFRRGRPVLGERKHWIWSVFSKAREGLRARGLATHQDVCRQARLRLDGALFDHAVIDEAQDLSVAELGFLRSLVEPGADDLFFTSDAAQRLYWRPLPWKKARVQHLKPELVGLTVNYRTSERIRQAAEAVVPEGLRGPDNAVEARHAGSLSLGREVVYAGSPTEVAALDQLGRWLDQLFDDSFAPGDVAIFQHYTLDKAPGARNLCLSKGLEVTTTDAPREGAVTVGTMHSSKGLEFRAVILLGCGAEHLPDAHVLGGITDPAARGTFERRERARLYVAMTRARERLFISYVGAPSPFLGEPAEAALEELEATLFEAPTLFRLSASRVGQALSIGCDRYLRYSSASAPAQKAVDGVPTDRAPLHPLAEAIFESGYQWERDALARLGDAVYVAEGEGDVTERHFSVDASLELLRTAPVGTYLYQLSLETPPAFYRRFSLNPRLAGFSTGRPDLVEVQRSEGGRRRLVVIDMKRGDQVKITHRVQLLVYAYMLAANIEEHGIADLDVDECVGAVWLGWTAAPMPVDLQPLHTDLARFFNSEANRVFGAASHEVEWHLKPRCERCAYVTSCQAEARDKQTLSLIAGMHTGEKRACERQALRTVAEVAEAPAEALPLPGRRRPTVRLRARALHHGEGEATGATDRGFTRTEQPTLSLYLTLHEEPYRKQLFAAGLHAKAEGVADDVWRGRMNQTVFVAATPADSEGVGRRLVAALQRVFDRLDAYNAGCADAARVVLRLYVWSWRELRALRALLHEQLDNDASQDDAASVLLYVQDAELLRSEMLPARSNLEAVTVLQTAIKRTMALPVEVSYTLPETLAALGEVGYARDDRWDPRFGAGLRGEAAHLLWERSEGDVREIEARVERYLEAAAAICHAMRVRVGGGSPALRPFSLGAASAFRDTLLSRVAFFARHERALACQQVAAARLSPRGVFASSPRVLELVWTPAGFEVLGDLEPDLGPSSYGHYLLSADTEAGLRALRAFDDFAHRAVSAPAVPPDLAVVDVARVEPLGEDACVVHLTWRADAGVRHGLEEGDRLLLSPRFIDGTTDRALRALKALDDRRDRTVLGDVLLGRRVSPPAQPSGLRARVLAHPRLADLMASKRSALDAVLAGRVRGVWGPPGTGKTYFLAAVIVAMASAHRRGPFRVWVSGFTHAAIENLVGKVASFLESDPASLRLAKVGWRGQQRPGSVVELSKHEVGPWMGAAGGPCLVGGTVWAMAEASHRFDLVVVDEASQVRLPEGLIAASKVAAGGRLIFAGDHCQLPPIVQGDYPVPEGSVPLHGSVFDALRASAPGERAPLSMLHENFRMNEVLTGVPAALLYSTRYTCATDAQRGRRLQLGDLSDQTALIRALLDPSYPLTVALLRGLPPGKDNAFEAELAAQLVIALKGALLTDGKPYGAGAFAREGVFVVAPHRSQIRRIRRALKAEPWEVTPRVDTVDTMQGQEADVAIVSYGVSDADFAAREASFIYGRSRLNVAITRARDKCILLMPSELLDISPELLQDPEVEAGVTFMRGVIDRASRERLKFELEGGVVVEILRSSGT